MNNANPSKRPVGRSRQSTTQATPHPYSRAPPYNKRNTALSNPFYLNSIAHSNETSNHFLGAGTFQRPWMRQDGAAQQPSLIVSTPNLQTRSDISQNSEGAVRAFSSSTVAQSPVYDAAHAQPTLSTETQLPTDEPIASTTSTPVEDPGAPQHAETDQEKGMSNSNTTFGNCDHNPREANKTNRVEILDLTSAEDDSEPTEAALGPVANPSSSSVLAPVPQPTVSSSLPILEVSDNFHLTARNDPNPSVDLDAWEPSHPAQDNDRSNASILFPNTTVSRSNMSPQTSTEPDLLQIGHNNSFAHEKLTRPPLNSHNTDPVTNSLPHIDSDSSATPRRQDTSTSTPLMQQSSKAASVPNAPPAQLLTPEPSPLNQSAPLSQYHRRVSTASHLVRPLPVTQTAPLYLHHRSSVGTQPAPHSRTAQARSAQNSSPADIATRQQRPYPSIITNPASADTRGLAYLATLDSSIRDMSQHTDLNNYQWELRAPWLRDACQRGDLFFLHLNQLFCMRNMNVASIRHLGIGQDCDGGFAVLENLFGKNTALPRELLALLGGWPNSTYSLELNEQAKQWTSEIIRFLPVLGSNWADFRQKCMVRLVPPMVCEIVHYLGCPASLLLPQAIFCSIQQSLNPSATPTISTAVFRLFTDNVKAAYSGQPESGDYSIFRIAYQSIYAQHLTTPGLDPRLLNEIKYILHQDPPRRMHVAATPQTTPGAIQDPRMQMRSSHRHSNEAVPTTTVTGHSPTGTAVPVVNRWVSGMRNREQSRNVQTISGPLVPPIVPANRQARLNQQPQNSTESIQSNHMQTQNSNSHHVDPIQVLPYTPIAPADTPSLPALELARHESMISTQERLLPFNSHHLPDLIVNPDPIQEALHQAHLRQPTTKLKNYSTSVRQRLYQYIEAFVLKPYQWVPASGFIKITFGVPQNLLDRRSETIEQSKGPLEVPKRIIGLDSTLFNLRCAKLGDRQDMTDIESSWAALPTYWPQHVFISINGKHLEIRRKRHHGRDLPIDVTPFIEPGENEVKISIHPEASERDINHGIAVEVIGFRDHKQALTAPTRISAEASLESIIAIMAPQRDPNDDDLVLMDDKLTISVTDPFSSRIFTTPVRGKTCKHRECFDLETFLDSRQSDYKDSLTSVYAWHCPICKADARPHSLVVDEFFQEVRDKIVEQGCEDETRAIIVTVDGAWQIKPNTDADQARARSSSRHNSRSACPSPTAAAAKVMQQGNDRPPNPTGVRQGSMSMAGSTANNLLPRNPRVAEIIELD